MSEERPVDEGSAPVAESPAETAVQEQPPARKRWSRRRVATIAVDAMTFHQPVLVGDVVSCYAEVIRVGRTSMSVRIEVIAHRDRGATEIKVTEGLFTFVALDENHRPRPVDTIA